MENKLREIKCRKLTRMDRVTLKLHTKNKVFRKILRKVYTVPLKKGTEDKIKTAKEEVCFIHQNNLLRKICEELTENCNKVK